MTWVDVDFWNHEDTQRRPSALHWAFVDAVQSEKGQILGPFGGQATDMSWSNEFMRFPPNIGSSDERQVADRLEEARPYL